MTDKIMINDVDVSGCGFPDKYGYCRCYHTDLGKTPDEFKNIKCKDNPNCYYKQLKRKEEECDKYEQSLKEIKGIAKKSTSLSCTKWDCDCTKCNDSITNSGENCMRFGLAKILQKCEVLDAKCN